jgi:hypothetical protein
VRSRGKNRRSLHYAPGFPVESGGVDQLHAAPCGEPHTGSLLASRGRKSGSAPVGMTILLWPHEFQRETLDPSDRIVIPTQSLSATRKLPLSLKDGRRPTWKSHKSRRWFFPLFGVARPFKKGFMRREEVKELI